MRTQGDWKVGLVPAGAATDARFWITADGKRIADVRDQPGGETEANARLLAAAPKLHRALRAMCLMGTGTPWRAWIAGTRGRIAGTNTTTTEDTAPSTTMTWSRYARSAIRRGHSANEQF